MRWHKPINGWKSWSRFLPLHLHSAVGVSVLMTHVQNREVSASWMPNRRRGRGGQLIWIAILCILNNQNPPLESEHYVCYHELAFCINATKVLRIWLEPCNTWWKNHQMHWEFPQRPNSPAAGRTVWETLPEHLSWGNMGWFSRGRDKCHTIKAQLQEPALPWGCSLSGYLGYLELRIFTQPNCLVLLGCMIRVRIKSMAWFNFCVTGLPLQLQELQKKHKAVHSLLCNSRNCKKRMRL